MASVTAEWGVYSVRRSLRGQAITGFAMTMGLGLAFLNLLWFFGKLLCLL